LRIPKKKELLELQKKYRTDKKIGEVYGVPARLVAYWRNKKKITSYSFPKYSEDKIREIWERFGDDARAGEELNISRAGFQQWRRKYHIDHKPMQLKLEQLELPLPELSRRKGTKRETIAQKLLAKKSGLKRVEVGEIVNIEPDLAISLDDTTEVLDYFNQIGGAKVWDPSKIAIVLNQRLPSTNGNKPTTYKAVREFIKKQKIKYFYDIGQGVGQQLIWENAHILPGQMALSTEPYGTCHGGVGAFSSMINQAEMAAIWAIGRIWLKVPETIKIIINGKLPRGVYVKDIVLKLSLELGNDGANYRTIEFYGPAVSAMTMSERFVLCGMLDRIGCKAAIVPFDDHTARHLRKILKARFTSLAADSDAVYAAEIDFDSSSLIPQICPMSASEISKPVEEMAGKNIDQVIIGCCTNGKIEDLEIAARILRGHTINHDVRLMIVPGSRKVMAEALEKGLIKLFMDSGCIVMAPGCTSCISAFGSVLDSGERALTTSACLRSLAPDFNGEIYQVSPATAAASALDGIITDPRKHFK
jgi:3-isopropylmalate/(R)-2-methylmalate dehydratase large subunit